MTFVPRGEDPAAMTEDQLHQLAGERAPILDQLSEGVIIAGADGRLMFVNQAAERLHGVRKLDVAPDQYSASYSLFTMAGEPYPFAELPLTRAVARGETVEDARWRIRRPDGSEVIAIGSARPLVAEGAQIGAILNVRDDSERYEAERKLRESEEQTKLVLDTTASAFYSVDRDGNTTLVSRPFLDMMGFSDESEVLGRKLHDLIHHTHPDGSHYPVEECPIYCCAAAATPAHVPEELFFRLDGTAVPVEYWVAPIMRGDAYIGATCTITDLTQRKAAEEALRESEARFRNMADNAPVMMWVTEPDGSCIYLNKGWYEFTGQTEEEALGFGWLKAVHPDDEAEAERAFVEANANAAHFRVDYRLRRTDGVYRWAIDAAAPRFGAEGQFLGFVGSVIDINERREAENVLANLNETLELRVSEEIAQRAEAEEALRQSQKMETLGQLTGGIAHDFNNLLQIITGNLDLLRRTMPVDSPRLQRAVDHAFRGAERAAVLTQRLLAFSRRQPLAPKTVDANKLVAGMSEMLQRTIGEAIAIETVHAPGLWRVEVDPNQLENAILNLAVNSRDAMPNGGKLTIETANTDLDHDYAERHSGVAAGPYVAICVSDSGSGMDPTTTERAFDPFFTTKEVGKGTGLGLSMVYGFVKQSGGHLKIYSEPGEGTTVNIYLPRHHGVADETADEAAAAAPSAGAETILVCEDDDDVRAYSVESLRELGYRVIEAPDGDSALRLLQGEQGGVDLLFTDIVLPGGLTGAVVAERARAFQPGLRVLFTTGYARNAVVHQGRLDAGVELLSKPFSYADLATRIRDLLDKPAGT